MTTTAPAAQPPKKQSAADALISELLGLEGEFAKALPPQIDAKKFLRCAITSIRTNPKVVEANRESFLGELMKCAQDGLIPDGREAAITTFQLKRGEAAGTTVAKYIPMIGGILKKVRNSGELAMINAQVVYKNDKFEYWTDGDGEHIEHRPEFDKDRGEWRLVYAMAKMKDGTVYVEVMTKAQVDAVAKVSRSGDSGPWGGDFKDEMRRKTAIRRLSKRLPSSSDLDQVIQRDDDLYDLAPGKPAAGAKDKPSSRLSKAISEKEPEPTPSEPVPEEESAL